MHATTVSDLEAFMERHELRARISYDGGRWIVNLMQRSGGLVVGANAERLVEAFEEAFDRWSVKTALPTRRYHLA